MLHCAPEATLKPKRFEFTPKTVITDVNNGVVCKRNSGTQPYGSGLQRMATSHQEDIRYK